MLFTRPTACKEARVDSVSKPTLKHCADQLSSVFRDILNTSVVTCLLQQLNHAKQGKNVRRSTPDSPKATSFALCCTPTAAPRTIIPSGS